MSLSLIFGHIFLGGKVMKRSKAIICAVLAVIMLFAICACGASNTPANDTPSNSTPANNTPSSNTTPAKDDSKKEDKPAQEEKKETYVFSMASSEFEGSTWNQMVEVPLMELMTEKTNGRVTWDFYPSGTLSKQGECFEAILNGAADVGYDACNFYVDTFPYIEFFTMMGWNISEDFTERENLAIDFTETFRDAYLYDNFKLLARVSLETFGFMSSVPIRTAADVKNVPCRSLGFTMDWLNNLGANCTTMPAVEVYESLKLNVIDASVSAIGALTAYKLYEVCDYFTAIPRASGESVYVMSKKMYESMDAEIQAAVDDTFADMKQKCIDFVITNEGKVRDEVLAGNPNFEFINPTPEQIAEFFDGCDELIQARVKELDAKGLDGTGAYEWMIAHTS